MTAAAYVLKISNDINPTKKGKRIMPINTEQYKNQGLSGQDRKAIVEANLKRLDYAEGNGLLSKAKKNCCRGSCIFLSAPAERDKRHFAA